MRNQSLLAVLAVASSILAAKAGAESRPVLLGYSAAWRDAACPPADYDYTNLTAIARAFVRPTADGSVEVPDGYFNADLEKHAREHHVKLLLSLGGGGASGADWLSMATDAKHREHFLGELAKLMAEHQYDGVDLDWEPPDPSKADGDAYRVFIVALRAKFPHALLTTALPADAYQTRFTPWAEVTKNLDYVNVMAYDFSGPWSGVAGHATNLFPAGDYKPAAGHSVAEGLKHLIDDAHVPPAKLLVGLNLWGYRFRADHLGDAFPRNAPDVSDALTFQQTQALFRTGHYQSHWDAGANMPYLERNGGGSVICYDDAESVRRKCEYAKGLGCAGVMVWNLGSDATATQTPLIDAAVQTFGLTARPLSRATLQAQIADAAEEIRRGPAGSAPAAAVPADLAKLPVDQLVALNARLQEQAATANDARWMAKTPAGN